MDNTDELDDANEGLPMDVESTDAAVADEVEPTTISAAYLQPASASTTKVSKVRHLNFRAAHACQGEFDPHPSLPRIQHLFGRAALLAGDQVQDHVQLADGLEAVPARVPRAELQRRANIKFSGISGAVVASGSEAATSAPTFTSSRTMRSRSSRGCLRRCLIATPSIGHVGCCAGAARSAC